MVELVDAADSKSAGFTPLRVQVSLPVPQEYEGVEVFFYLSPVFILWLKGRFYSRFTTFFTLLVLKGRKWPYTPLNENLIEIPSLRPYIDSKRRNMAG